MTCKFTCTVHPSCQKTLLLGNTDDSPDFGKLGVGDHHYGLWVGWVSRQRYTTRAGEGLRAREDPGVEDFQTTSSTARARFPSPYFWVYFCRKMSLESTSPSMAEG